MTSTSSRERGPGTALLVTAAAVVGTAALLAATVSVLSAVMARRIVTPPTKREQDTRIHAVDLAAGTITLQTTPDTVLPGEYSLWFTDETGHARLGEIIRSDAAGVTRRLTAVDFGDLASARLGRLAGYHYLGPAELGFPFEDVVIQTGLGDAPAWLIPAAEPDGRWAIQVHGRGVQRPETLRAVPAFREAGYTSLLVSYRNDREAPASLDGRYGLGDTEWLDVEEAIGFARSHGATSVVLMGWSMGGAIALHAASRTEHKDILAGIVLDSPVVDWADVVSFHGEALGFPSPIMAGAMRVMGQRWGGLLTGQATPIDFRRLDVVARADDLSLPILLMHSDDDGYVPSTGSRALALRRPDLVTFVPFTIARHTKLCNYDPVGWNRAITRWLDALVPSGHTSPPHHPPAAGEDRTE
ncbi:Serine aminopeptidase, S33 [Cryobacterium psychrotolerans]|uniref:Serine aminopeptidase, S33 n=1 Tax=Cryobacterium psychrotolerans TaxID=386301 RepID=A0A1G9GDQ4_9MICO|nr:alpha/beta fold hydrolase [Cryobacterium psychrotolerans]TFD88208.1 alpha/beta fold hydrolase [Cryobacterium psychrotolerans]SDK98854.1 Serine aminopeptidase, S33 [Cryobacterium psychrotolerans]